jgi:hypothetical protein
VLDDPRALVVEAATGAVIATAQPITMAATTARRRIERAISAFTTLED